MALTVTPEVYFYRHVKSTSPSLGINLSVALDGTGVILNDPSLLFTFDGLAASELEVPGTLEVTVGLTNAVNQLEVGMHELNIRVFDYSTQEAGSVLVYLLVAAAADQNYYPLSLDFESVRNVDLADIQQVYLTFQEDYTTIDLPDWLTLQNNMTIGNGRIFDIQPKEFEHTPDPEYSGDIVFHFTAFSITIPVTYKIHAGYDSSYSKSIHFTRDNDELVFYKTVNETTFLRLMCVIKIFGYTGELVDERQINFDLSFNENRARINLGKEIESYIRLLDRPLSMPNKVNGFYPPVEVAMTAMELKYSDFTIVNQDLIPIQKFLRGRNPYYKIDEPFWLAFRPNTTRYVTENASILLQAFKPAGRAAQSFQVYLNDEMIRTMTIGQNLFNFLNPYFIYTTLNVNSIPDLEVGDKISVDFERNGHRRHFIVMPPQPYSFRIAYRTIWETMDVIEFTGPASFGVEYAHETTQTMRNYTEVTNKIETENPQRVTINTGWIFKSQAYLIDELIQSKKAFLLSKPELFSSTAFYPTESAGAIELIPVQQKIVNHESDENRVSFDVEFVINKRYADEIYSR